jgi:hypothetical protein
MSQQPGWWPDPYGRYEQRYFDGSTWTAHVIGNNQQQVDPLGTTVSIPIATPVNAAAGPHTGDQLRGFLDLLGPEARDRPPVHLSIALAGVGGAATAVGIAAAIIGGENGNRARNICAAAVVVLIAYALRAKLHTQPEVRSAAVGAVVVGLPGLAAALTNGSSGGGALALAAALLILAWVLPIMRGRPVLLGAGAVAIVLALTTVGSNNTSSNPFFDFAPADVVGGQTWLFVLAALALLGVVWWLDGSGYHGVGTSLVVAALLAAALAVLKVVENLTSSGGAFLLAIAGLVVAFVGDHGQRRASTWFGVAVVAVGTIAVFASATKPTTPGETATMLVLAGVVLVVAGIVVKVARRRREPAAGGEPAGPSVP